MSKSKTRLYFGKLSEQTRERDLEKFVRGYGKVSEISVKRGYGFVEFVDPHDAADVVYELNGRDLLGERVIIEHAREPSRKDYGYSSYAQRNSGYGGYGGSRNYDRGYDRRDRGRYHDGRPRGLPIRTNHRLLVENLSSRINWQELKEIFSDVGKVMYCDAHKRKSGVAILEFATKDDMKTALKKMDGEDLNGRKIKLSVESVRSRSRSRSRHRSRSRSPKRRHRHSRSKSPRRSRSTSKTRDDKQGSRSRSKSEEARSRSQTPDKDGDESNRESGHESGNESPNRNGEDDDDEDVQHEKDDE